MANEKRIERDPVADVRNGWNSFNVESGPVVSGWGQKLYSLPVISVGNTSAIGATG